MEEYITLTPPPPVGKKGFTLAEVLITLAIIGVVAALTIPTVVRNYQKQQYYTGFMKAYNSLSRAFNNSIAENGPVATWNIPTEDNSDFENFVNDYFLPYLKIQKKCIGANNECFVQNYLTLDGSTTYQGKPNSYKCKYVLVDGFSISFMPINGGRNSGISRIYVDINGFQKPNKAGRDLFLFTIMSPPGIIAPYALYWQYNETSKYMNINDIKAYCQNDISTADPTNNGNNCGALLLREGKMNY